MKTKNIIKLLFILFLTHMFHEKLVAQMAPNFVDSLGLKQGKWEEYKIPYNMVTEEVEIKIPKAKTKYYTLTKDKDRKYFPIIESVGEYKNGLKKGIWIEYFPNGSIKSKIEYENGVPFGNCEMLWENGNLKMKCKIGVEYKFSMDVYNEDGTQLSKQEGIKAEVIKAIYEN